MKVKVKTYRSRTGKMTELNACKHLIEWISAHVSDLPWGHWVLMYKYNWNPLVNNTEADLTHCVQGNNPSLYTLSIRADTFYLLHYGIDLQT